jgi:pimeloyl-ACP methyl ester carboxylesterase
VWGAGTLLSLMLRSLAAGTLFGEAWGADPAKVVALHGWRRTHDDFSGVLGPTSPGGALASLAPDLPGFGATPPPPAAWGSAEYADAVAGLIESEVGSQPGGPRVVVVGHSLGGRVGATLAATRPDLVGALVLVGAPLVRRPGRSRPPVVFRMLKTLRRLGLVNEQRMESARQAYGSADYRAAHGVMRDILVRLVNESYDDVLASLHCPVELVWGAHDTEAPLWVGEQIAERLPSAELTVCESTGHLLPLERPHELRAAIERALAREESAGP